MKYKLTKFHFYLLAFLIIHSLVLAFGGFGFCQYIVVGLKAILFISGLILFIFYLKPLRKLAIYFSYYFITPVVVLLGYLFGGVFLVGILMSLLLFPIMPKPIVYEKDDFVIYSKYEGFLGSCCKYEIYQRKYYLFEKFHSEIESEGIDNQYLQIVTDKEIKKLKEELQKN